MKLIMVNATLGLLLLVTVFYLCEAQSNRFRSVSSSRRSPSSRFTRRPFSDRRQSSRFQPVRSRSWSRSSPSRIVPRQNSFRPSNQFQRQQNAPEQGTQINSINNLSNAILLSALLGMDMPRDQRMSNQRMILSHLLGGSPAQNQSPFSGFSDRGSSSSSSILSSSSHGSRSPGSFISSLPGHNLIMQSSNQPQPQPLVIEAGGQIQVQEIKKPDGQTQVVINAGQNSPSSNRATTNAASTVSLSTVNPYILSGEDPPEKEPSPLQDVQELAKLLKAMGINTAKAAAAVGR
ncbi:uncharacterized protein LOC117315579 [Pecten maximus]|uniref:uncharacterized protein LOC117315579 n=1 Tax=Pecten maximus TaxID=6579 RepID=UPI001458F4AA|nr:uncharacterized protein LOC117315579 [Pecten maximus]